MYGAGVGVGEFSTTVSLIICMRPKPFAALFAARCRLWPRSVRRRFAGLSMAAAGTC